MNLASGIWKPRCAARRWTEERSCHVPRREEEQYQASRKSRNLTLPLLTTSLRATCTYFSSLAVSISQGRISIGTSASGEHAPRRELLMAKSFNHPVIRAALTTLEWKAPCDAKCSGFSDTPSMPEWLDASRGVEQKHIVISGMGTRKQLAYPTLGISRTPKRARHCSRAIPKLDGRVLSAVRAK